MFVDARLILSTDHTFFPSIHLNSLFTSFLSVYNYSITLLPPFPFSSFHLSFSFSFPSFLLHARWLTSVSFVPIYFFSGLVSEMRFYGWMDCSRAGLSCVTFDEFDFICSSLAVSVLFFPPLSGLIIVGGVRLPLLLYTGMFEGEEKNNYRVPGLSFSR